jgi:hypothetical protein
MTVEEKDCSFKVICDDITKSEGDDRLYRGLVLQNDMKILIVSDPSTEKAAASMDVHIGIVWQGIVNLNGGLKQLGVPPLVL